MIGSREAELRGEGDRHIPAEELARLAERAFGEDIPPEQDRHLSSCRRCFATFAEFARSHAEWNLIGAREELPEDLRELALAVAGPQAAHDPGSRRSRWWQRDWRPILVPAMAIMATIVIAVMLGSSLIQDRSEPEDLRFAAINKAMLADSEFGLVYPGGEQTANDSDSPYRSGSPSDATATRAALAELAEEHRITAPTPEAAYWLIGGHLALTELGISRNLLDEARQLYPSDDRFDLLAAHLAFKDNDLPGAKRILVTLHRHNPRDGLVQLNLGIVMAAMDDPAAADVLQAIIEDNAGSGLAARAAAELEREGRS
jgi:hypothetical protein